MHAPDGLDFTSLQEVLDRITSRLVESSDPGALFEAVVQIAMDTTEAQACSLYLEQPDEGDSDAAPTIVMVAGAGYELHRVGKAVYNKGQGLTGSIWEQSQSVKYDTTQALENARGPWQGVYNSIIRQKVPDWVCSSLIGVPLRLGTRTIGVIKVENKRPGPPAHFSERDQRVLELIASTMALAIENRRLSEKAYSSILTALREVSEMLVSKEIMPFSALCDRIVRKCIEVFSAQACSLYLETPGSNPHDPTQTITMVAGAGYELHRVGKAVYSKGQGLTGSIWEQSQSVKYDTTQELENAKGPWQGLYNDIIRQSVPEWVCSSLIGVPLRIGTRAIGVIKVENKNPAPQAHFSHEELRSLEILASNIALALEMLNRHREIFWQGEKARAFAHNLANQVQNALLNVEFSNADLRRSPHSAQLVDVQDRLVIVHKTLTELEQLRVQTLTDTPVGRHRTAADVKMLVEDLLRRSDKILAEKGIFLEKHLPPEPLFVNVDRDQILQALGNILLNAIEALASTPQPRISIEIEHRPEGKEVAIAVVDSGPGLTDDQRARFQHTGSIVSTKHSGIGAGLPEARRCCGDNSGYLEAFRSGVLGAGGAFRIILPTCDPDVLRLAVIDDDERVIDSFRVALRNRNDIDAAFFASQECLVPGGTSAGRATDAAINQCDVILLDCYFEHGVDGIQLYRELSKAGSPLAKKILLMSGHEKYLQSPGVKVYNKYAEILRNFDDFATLLRDRRTVP